VSTRERYEDGRYTELEDGRYASLEGSVVVIEPDPGTVTGAPPAIRPPDPLTRFLAEDIMTGQIKTLDVGFDDWNYAEVLCRGGNLEAGLILTSDNATEQILDPWRTAIYPETDGRIDWGGVLLPPQLSLGAASLSISCFGWLDYWNYRNIRNVIGQPEAGGLLVYKPNRDASSSHVFGAPDSSHLWANIDGGYTHNQGVVSSITPGDVPAYQANFNVPPAADFPSLHPIFSVTLGIVAQGATSPRVLTPQIKIGSNTYNGTPRWTTNPDTGLPWTPTDIEAFATSSSGGFFTDPNAVGFDTVVNQMYLSVSNGDGTSNFFTDTEQFDIFRALVLDAQSQTKFGFGYDLGIDVVWDQPSGVIRDRLEAYRPFQTKNLGEALRQLAAVDNGFDFGMEYQLNPTTNRIDKAIRLYYPRKGRETNFLYEYKRGVETNVVARGFADPVSFAWVGDGWGSGNDDTRLKTPYIDEALRGVYPPYDAAPTFSSVIQPDTLAANTAAVFARTNRPKRTPVFRVDPKKSPKWGEVGLGDVVSARIDDGYGSTGPIPQRVRITGTKVASDNTYEVVLSDPLLSEESP
jgi:hypothetical protein